MGVPTGTGKSPEKVPATTATRTRLTELRCQSQRDQEPTTTSTAYNSTAQTMSSITAGSPWVRSVREARRAGVQQHQSHPTTQTVTDHGSLHSTTRATPKSAGHDDGDT